MSSCHRSSVAQIVQIVATVVLGPIVRTSHRDGQDLRYGPTVRRGLATVVGKQRLNIVCSELTVEDGALIFRQACKLG
jgi:hypothetical protein